MNENIRLAPHEKKFRGKDPQDGLIKYLRTAVIKRVDYETGYVDIEWREGVTAYRSFVSLPAAYSSLRGCIRGMPEEGSLVICGWKRGQTHTLEDPVILSYVDTDLNQLNNYSLIRTNKTLNDLKDIAETYTRTLEDGSESVSKSTSMSQKIGYNIIRGKRRKIYPGEIQIESTQGSEAYFDEDVYLSNSKLNEIELRSADQSLRISTNQIYSITQGARTWQGMITREPSNSFIFQPTVLPNGQKIQIITDSHNPIHLGGKAYTENRIEMFEKADSILKVSEVNSSIDISDQTPFISFVLGTLVGNDKKDGSKYGKILRPQIYGSSIAVDPSLDYLECMAENGDYDKLASCFHLQFTKSRAQIDIDKEGHLFTYFPASSGRHPLGAGRSWETLFDGSVKAVIGAESANSYSLILDTKGSIKASLGSDKDGRSAFIVAQKGMHTEIMAPADDGTAYFMKMKGDHISYVDGNYNLNVSGNFTVVVKGKIQEQILGIKEENYVNDKNNVYGGAKNSVIIKNKSETIGYNRTVTISGNKEIAIGVFTPAIIDTPNQYVDEIDILPTGGQRTSLVSGHIKQETTTGNIKRYILSGDSLDTGVTTDPLEAGASAGFAMGFLDEITTGNHKINVKTVGNIKRLILSGNPSDTDSAVSGESINGFLDVISNGNHKIDVKVKGDITRNILTGDTAGAKGFKDTITTGNIEQDVTLGDIKRTVTTKNSVGIADTVNTGNIEQTVTLGNIKQTTTTGDIKVETVTKGDIKRTTDTSGDIVDTATTQGNIKHNTTTGDITDAIVTGSRTVSIQAGDFKVDVSGGNIKIQTALGNIDVTAATGQVNITGSLMVNIQSGVKIVNQAPLVNLGPLPAQGGIVTGLPIPSTLCFITGAPHLCSATVTASL